MVSVSLRATHPLTRSLPHSPWLLAGGALDDDRQQALPSDQGVGLAGMPMAEGRLESSVDHQHCT